MPRFTEHTVTTRKALEARLDRTRSDCYGTALDELDYGLVSVAVPVFDARRRIVVDQLFDLDNADLATGSGPNAAPAAAERRQRNRDGAAALAGVDPLATFGMLSRG
ncbi:IclR family transcriptional regulator domain-containing protein [Sphingomonas sp. S1-29]|uniref:IclR family transcriptional regulator domain-containing protein n=1 Tax=Sphingomonas sp. S1-29 TaxID=2991074 RepID=UPI002AD51C02|nr:IclR family transcriptional regulator C-terminal domain-containing protein [Sphingomonas sp. S1-29]